LKSFNLILPKNDVLNHTDPATLTALLRDKANNITPEQVKKMMGVNPKISF